MDAADKIAKVIQDLTTLIESQQEQIQVLSLEAAAQREQIIDISDAMGAMLWVTSHHLSEGSGLLIEARMKSLALAAEARGRPVFAARLRSLGAHAARIDGQEPSTG